MQANSNVVNIKRPAIWLLGICLIHLILWIIKKPPVPETDDFFYVEEAKNILNGQYHFTPSPKNHRLALILPVALFMGIFGNSPWVVSLFPLLVSLASISLLYLIIKRMAGTGPALLAAALLGFNILQIDFSVSLFPDVVLGFWMLLFFYTFYQWTQKGEVKFLLLNLLCFVGGFFTKELMVAIIPYALLVLLLDVYRSKTAKRLLTYVASFSFLVMAICFTAWCMAGDFLFFLHGVDEYHNEAFGNHFTATKIAQRLFIEPFQLLNASPGLLSVVIPAIILFPYKSLRGNQNDFSFHAGILFFTLLAYLWAGSSSITAYVPVWLIERMWIPLLIPACLLIVSGLEEANRAEFIFLAITFALLGFEQSCFYGWKRLLLYLLFAAAFALPSINKIAGKYRLPIVLLSYLILAFYFVLTNSGWGAF